MNQAASCTGAGQHDPLKPYKKKIQFQTFMSFTLGFVFTVKYLMQTRIQNDEDQKLFQDINLSLSITLTILAIINYSLMILKLQIWFFQKYFRSKYTFAGLLFIKTFISFELYFGHSRETFFCNGACFLPLLLGLTIYYQTIMKFLHRETTLPDSKKVAKFLLLTYLILRSFYATVGLDIYYHLSIGGLWALYIVKQKYQKQKKKNLAFSSKQMDSVVNQGQNFNQKSSPKSQQQQQQSLQQQICFSSEAKRAFPKQNPGVGSATSRLYKKNTLGQNELSNSITYSNNFQILDSLPIGVMVYTEDSQVLIQNKVIRDQLANSQQQLGHSMGMLMGSNTMNTEILQQLEVFVNQGQFFNQMNYQNQKFISNNNSLPSLQFLDSIQQKHLLSIQPAKININHINWNDKNFKNINKKLFELIGKHINCESYLKPSSLHNLNIISCKDTNNKDNIVRQRQNTDRQIQESQTTNKKKVSYASSNHNNNFKRDSNSKQKTTLMIHKSIIQFQIQRNTVSFELQLIPCLYTFTNSQLSLQQQSQKINTINNYQLPDQEVQSYKKKNSQQQQQSNQLACVLVIIEDVTDKFYKLQLEEVQSYKLKLLASISHELRTQLNCSILMLQVAQFKMEQVVFDDYILPALQSNQLELSIVNDILDFAQIEAGTFELNVECVSLKDILQECYELLELRCRKKGLQFKFIIKLNNSNEQQILNHASSLSQQPPQLQQQLQDKTLHHQQSLQQQQQQSLSQTRPGLSEENCPASNSTQVDGNIFIQGKQPLNQIQNQEIQSSNLSNDLQSQDEQLTFHTDRRRLQQIILNLLQNAIKFTQSGHIKLKIKLVKDNLAVISVSDTGIGVPEENKSIIFHLFGQSLSQMKKLRSFGAGLGLTISNLLVKMLANSAQSSIQLKSNKNHGSKFSFEIIDLNQPIYKYKQSFMETRQSIQLLSKMVLTFGSRSFKSMQSQSQLAFSDKPPSLEQQLPHIQHHSHQRINQGNNSEEEDEVNNSDDDYQKNADSEYQRQVAENYLDQSCDIADANQDEAAEEEEEQEKRDHEKRKKVNQTNQNKFKKYQFKQEDAYPTSMQSIQKISSGNPYNDFPSVPDQQIQSQIYSDSNLMISPSSKQNSEREILFKSPQSITERAQNRQITVSCQCIKVLIVDDNEFNLMALSSLLKNVFKTQCDQAGSGKIALQKIKYRRSIQGNCCCQNYNLILMDLDMPEWNGFETTQRIQEYYNTLKDTPPFIVACTAFVGEDQKIAAKNAGMSGFINKPVRHSEIQNFLQKYCVIR